jgi:pilus assembly protein CpaC
MSLQKLPTINRSLAALSFALVCIVLSALCAVSPAQAAKDSKPITLRIGEEKVIWTGRIKDVSIGNDQVIDVKPHPDGSKIIVFGLKEGYSSLTAGSMSFDVNVVGDIEQLRRDVAALVMDIPGVEVVRMGDRVVMDGVVKRRDDLERVQALVEAKSKVLHSLVLLDERDIVRKAQIQLKFQVLEISRSRDHNIGIDWSSGPVRVVLDTVSYIQFGPSELQASFVDPNDPLGTVRKPDDLLNFQSTADIRRVLDQDFFTTVSGEEVTFMRGQELIFSTSGGLESRFLVKETGLSVTATPVIDDDGDIDLRIEIHFSTVGEREFGGTIPALNTQRHKAHVQLREGQSFALSGFFRRDKGRTISGLPGLKDIPGLGVLFGSRAWQKGETDGIIVLTPVLLDPDRRGMRKTIKETLDIYDAADVKW